MRTPLSSFLPLLLILFFQLQLVSDVVSSSPPPSVDVTDPVLIPSVVWERVAGIAVDRSGCMDMDSCTRQFGGCECVEWNSNPDDNDLTCRNQSGYLGDYLYFYYCLMDSSLRPLSMCLIIGFLCFLGYFTFLLSSAHLIPGLTALVSKLSISNAVAAVTFLSFGNGAAQLFATWAAALHGSPGLAVSGVVGSGLVVLTVVLAVVVLVTPGHSVAVRRRPYVRDALAYLVGGTLVFVATYFGDVYLWEPVLLLLLYLAYVSVVFVGRHLYQRYKLREREALGILENSTELLDLAHSAATGNDGHGLYAATDDDDDGDYPMMDEVLFLTNIRDREQHRYVRVGAGQVIDERDERWRLDGPPEAGEAIGFVDDHGVGQQPGVLDYDAEVHRDADRLHNSSPTEPDRDAHDVWAPSEVWPDADDSFGVETDDHTLLLEPKPLGGGFPVDHVQQLEFGRSHSIVSAQPSAGQASLLVQTSGDDSEPSLCSRWMTDFRQSTKWDERNFLSKSAFVLSSPILLLRNLTIPQIGPTPNQFSVFFRFWMVVHPPFACCLVLFATGHFFVMLPSTSVPFFPVLFGFGFLLSLVVYFMTSPMRRMSFYWVFVCEAILMTMLWMYIVSVETMTILRALTRILDVSEALLGVSISSWITCSVALSSNTKTALLGLPGVALSACFGASTLVMLLGLGPSFLIALAVLGHAYVIPAAAFTPSLFASFAALAVVVLFLLVTIPLNRFRTSVWLSAVLLILYFCAAAVVLALELVYGK